MRGMYLRLFIMANLSFLTMFILMYAMVDRYANVFGNLNQVYMAGLMTAPMVIIELALMRNMYPSMRANIAIMIFCVAAGALFFFLIRQQSFVDNRQFLRSMIPHHGGAVLMCEKAPVTDPQIKALCKTIIASQQREIGQMQKLLAK